MDSLYVEQLNQPHNPAGTQALHIARHLQARQYLGTAVVVCDNPAATLSAVRKQWIKAARSLLRLRAGTLNAEEIMRLTHVIIHMQTLPFAAKVPNKAPGAAVYFAAPTQLTPLPDSCYTVYITADLPPDALSAMRRALPPDALVVNYTSNELALRPKAELEQRVLTEWQQLVAFLADYKLSPDRLVVSGNLQFAAMDEALDTLLGIADKFLRCATDFQHTINLAQPFTVITPEQQKVFEAVMRLAHRVQSLSPGKFNHYLVDSFVGAIDPFFLRDATSELYDDLENAAAHGSG